MERLVHVRLRCGDVVLETVRNRTEHLVDYTENVVAFKLRVHDDTNSILVVNLLDALSVYIYLLVYAVNTLDTSVNLRRSFEILAFETFRYFFLYLCDEEIAFILLYFENMLDLGIGIRIKVMERKILKLVLDGLDTESVCDRSVDIHCFKSGFSLLGARPAGKCTHVVETVTELDEHYSYVARHGKKDLSYVFGELLVLIENRSF